MYIWFMWFVLARNFSHSHRSTTVHPGSKYFNANGGRQHLAINFLYRCVECGLGSGRDR